MAQRLMCRRLGLADAAAAETLYAELVGDEPIDIGRFSSILDHSGSTIWGAERDGQVVAMVTLHLLPNVTQGGRPYGLIENVVTLRAHQGSGAGRAVMQAAIDHAWAENAYKIMLLTGQDTGVKGFYERLGFRADQKFGMQLRRVPPRRVAQ
ncbi:MAG: GNAT family N-acetyltransferase [Rhodobacteraceae bacterium]|nr:GNAT family N-acetyltransferase [Paracoccaceae bacterium]